MALDSGNTGSGLRGLIAALTRELTSAKELVLSLDVEVYSRPDSGSIGAHIRHDLNFVECLLKGLETGVVDHVHRERDRTIETDRAFAAARIDAVIDRLEKVDVDSRAALFVVSEIDRSMLHRSTVSREFEFVLSHTIHHHALIKQKLKDADTALDPTFGVAPSTLEYWRQAGRYRP